MPSVGLITIRIGELTMFEIFNNTNIEIEELEYLEKYINYLVEKEQLDKTIFNIIFVTNDEIHAINRQYRNVDRITDVISFALEDNGPNIHQGYRIIGDIYIAIEVAYFQAQTYNHSRKREVCFLATHGLLHLLGYDHIEESDEKVMFKKQKELLESYEITR